MLWPMTCAVCGEPLPDGARFCANCGAPVSTSFATEERKMVTVLFADLVDSTGLAQRLDPERARELLGRFFDAAAEELQALRGRPEKFIGDAVMAVFGLPAGHRSGPPPARPPGPPRKNSAPPPPGTAPPPPPPPG